MAVYTWEGNQVNITCEVFAYPSATISWFRDGQLLPSSNYSNIKIYNTQSASSLEVRGRGHRRAGWRRRSASVDRPLEAAAALPLASLARPDQWVCWLQEKPLRPAACLSEARSRPGGRAPSPP